MKKQILIATMKILFPVVAILIIGFLLLSFLDGPKHGQISEDFSAENITVSISPRKLLNRVPMNDRVAQNRVNFWMLLATRLNEHAGSRADRECSKKDITITQSMTGREPNGIPIYLVEIANLCATGCPIANIHLSCGFFSSSTLINPKLFKRVAYDDCLVNNKEPLAAGHIIAFTYTTNFMYPLAVSSATIKCR